MKAQYLGDIGDFGKVLLLSAITSLGLKVGVNWVLTENDEGSDGKHRDYPWYGVRHKANNPHYPLKRTRDDPRNCLACCCDEQILRKIVPLAIKAREKRSIGDLESLLLDVLPDRPMFFRDIYQEGETRRSKIESCLEKLDLCELVFFDPDNGIILTDAPAACSPKHIYLDELRACWRLHKSLLVYQHWPRPTVGVPAHMRLVESELRRALKDSKLMCLSLRRCAGRTYFLIIHPDHHERILEGKERIQRAVEPLSFDLRGWQRIAKPCASYHSWQFM